MKSIRLSLMVYFLGLLAVALLAASLLVYRNAEHTLAAKQQAMGQLLQAQYEDSRRKEESRLDETLREQAQSLARMVQVQFDSSRADLIQPLYLLGLLSATATTNGYVLAPTWIAEGAVPQRPERPERPPQRGETPPAEPGRRGRPSPRNEPPRTTYHEVRSYIASGIKLKGNELLLPGDGQVPDYFQIDHPPGRSYFSRSMAGRSFPLDPSAFTHDQLIQWVFDDRRLDRDIQVRRVVLKAEGVNIMAVRPARPPNQPGRSNTPRSVWVHEYSGPTIYVHYAAETHNRDAILADLQERRDRELAAIEIQTNDSLHDLRVWLLAISVAVFAATGVGGFWLVRLGLSPLRRLSDAVSRVSAKDFRLPLGERPLPVELRPIVERLTSTLGLLKRAFGREKQAAADISHELRTPLAALLTTTEFALRKPRTPEQYRELIGDCHTSAREMNQIVERLLTLARLDAGVDRLRPQSIDAAALARQCATVVRPLAEARGLKLTVEDLRGPAQAVGGDGACLVQIDPDKLREIVTNLLHNAIQYNRPGGSIDLRVVRANGSLEVKVCDTGIGIAAEVREHIFERFYRADPSRHCDELHAGLGLAIVKEYIDLMGGSIGVESTEGQGSTFRVLLPARPTL